jgi:hypothetical protein
MATQHCNKPESLPYDPVSSSCNHIADLAQSIAGVCSVLCGQHESDQKLLQQLTLMEGAARQICVAADHIIGDDMGGPSFWLDLPDMKQTGSES